MTTHVFIVDDNTFKYHLEYMFAGTGAKNYVVDFNDAPTTKLHVSVENLLVAMMADGWRVRKNDFVLFYLERDNSNFKKRDGRIFGIFQAVDNGIFFDNNDENQYLKTELKRSLTFRLKIRPYQVFQEGITEWEALDEIQSIKSPSQMTWSLIYRKLKGKRGNTMITIPEAEYLFSLLRKKNKNNFLNFSNYTFSDDKIVECKENTKYEGRCDKINILPRLITKAKKGNAFEVHLQQYIIQSIVCNTNKSLESSLEISNNVEWIGNEVGCGVGMQRIDIMLSKSIDATQRIIMPIELKSNSPLLDNIRQITRYVEWVKQYYVPNRCSDIQPILICLGGKILSEDLKARFRDFNDRNSSDGILPLKYIEYSIKDNDLFFEAVEYNK